jgi:hypothetical protein
MLRRTNFYAAVCLCVVCKGAVADEDSIGPDGIRSSLLNLHGSGVAIGQIEPTRPGVLFFDDFYTHIDVAPTDIFRQNGPAVINDAGRHGLLVAGVMIATDGVGIPGVADEADLYASTYIATGPGGEDIMKTIQQVVYHTDRGSMLRHESRRPLALTARLRPYFLCDLICQFKKRPVANFSVALCGWIISPPKTVSAVG